MKRATIAGLALSVLGTTVPSAHATFPGRNGRIILSTSGLETDPPPSGFYRSIRADGTDPVVLPLDVFAPKWSPDGGWIAYTEYTEGNDSALWRMRADGTDPSAITSFEGPPVYFADWSPDGSRITFSTTLWPSAWNSVIEVINADGSSRTQLTTGGYDQQPHWSSDGQTIAFVRCEGPGSRFSSFGECMEPRLMLMNPDGTNVRLLTQSPRAELGPDWAPSGKRIVHECSLIADAGRLGICITSVATSYTRTLYGRLAEASSPVWSPNGRRIAFVVRPRHEENEDTEIFTIRPDGTGLRQITDNARDDSLIQWLGR